MESGGSLTVRYKTELTDLTAEKDSILDINKDVVMKGDILIDRQAVMGGSFDYNSIFTSENISSLTVSNGINDIFKDTLINNAKGKIWYLKTANTILPAVRRKKAAAWQPFPAGTISVLKAAKTGRRPYRSSATWPMTAL